MLFNSIEFAIFLPIVFLLYWFVVNRNLRLQNSFIIAVSYLFYGWWDWRFLSLIIFSSAVDFVVGRQLGREQIPGRRKLLLTISILVNLGFLGFFKYFNFFADNFAAAFTLLGREFDPVQLRIILPVGISFYTFQTLSYTIDVYRRKLEPTKDVVAFFAFVSFFPQLVAGPIERATHLIPQFLKKREFNYGLAVDGLGQIIWGLFKKVVIADNCAAVVNEIFASPDAYGGSTLLLGAVLFAFQIYGDFSGYSDIAIGTGRLFGFDLMRNFANPYFSRDIAEFWRRWHISLSTWFRDYLYIPLGGSKGSLGKRIRNIFIIFIVSGFWHGANWTFIIWGFLNALYYLPLMIMKRNRRNLDIAGGDKYLPSLRDLYGMAITFLGTTLAWIFFRAASVSDAWIYLKGIFSVSLFEIPENLPLNLLVFIALFILIEWLGRHGQYAIQAVTKMQSILLRLGIFYLIAMIIFLFGGKEQAFIYFQF